MAARRTDPRGRFRAGPQRGGAMPEHDMLLDEVDDDNEDEEDYEDEDSEEEQEDRDEEEEEEGGWEV